MFARVAAWSRREMLFVPRPRKIVSDYSENLRKRALRLPYVPSAPIIPDRLFRKRPGPNPHQNTAESPDSGRSVFDLQGVSCENPIAFGISARIPHAIRCRRAGVILDCGAWCLCGEWP